ncbi:MAG: TIGR02646 family protein [Bacteroidales bacterium]|nr:TIGR02646 family protein [Bacteroidales bacterium]MCF8455426.1 TIGR02646 family protein [Bacteroidales bacterium]
MQYIKKQNTPPKKWESWFTKATGERSFDYSQDYGSLTEIRFARQFLITEQNDLCAYCQKRIDINNSSIEHVIPKEHNKEISTNYYNLVAVCNSHPKDVFTNKLHCDKERGSLLLSHIIFYTNSDVSKNRNNCYFSASADGTIRAKDHLTDNIKHQVEGFINILNLNHSALKETRAKDFLDGMIEEYHSIPPHQGNTFWQIKFDRLLLDKSHPFRQFLLIYIGNKIGIN